jgi:hypothetical protein
MDDSQELVDDSEDFATIVERCDEPTIPHEELIAELKREGLLTTAEDNQI